MTFDGTKAPRKDKLTHRVASKNVKTTLTYVKGTEAVFCRERSGIKLRKLVLVDVEGEDFYDWRQWEGLFDCQMCSEMFDSIIEFRMRSGVPGEHPDIVWLSEQERFGGQELAHGMLAKCKAL